MTESAVVGATQSVPHFLGGGRIGWHERAVPEAGPGELLLRGPTVMEGYHGNPEVTAATLTDDCWLRTGDLVAFSEGGELEVEEATPELLGAGDLDVCFFSVGTDASRELVPAAAASGTVSARSTTPSPCSRTCSAMSLSGVSGAVNTNRMSFWTMT